MTPSMTIQGISGLSGQNIHGRMVRLTKAGDVSIAGRIRKTTIEAGNGKAMRISLYTQKGRGSFLL
ncbi:MAG: hypothetical protein LBG96_01540 [Tannerella sp.]|nr:hypothetical protein [Tannerella sp.]